MRLMSVENEEEKVGGGMDDEWVMEVDRVIVEEE